VAQPELLDLLAETEVKESVEIKAFPVRKASKVQLEFQV
jgi:hypothetical protein